jgi:hypothetical protein
VVRMKVAERKIMHTQTSGSFRESQVKKEDEKTRERFEGRPYDCVD